MIRCQHSLRYARLWIAIAWFGVALLVFLSLVRIDMGEPVPSSDKYGHVAAYAVLMFWFTQLYDRRRDRSMIALFLFALGVVLEVLQYWTGYRSMEAADALADAAGVALGWLLAPPRTLHLLERVERAI